MLTKLINLLKNLFTTNNGEDFSFAKIMGAIGFLMIVFMVCVGVPLWTLIGMKLSWPVITLAEWSAYYTGSAVLIGAAYAGLTGLLYGTTKSENPGGTE